MKLSVANVDLKLSEDEMCGVELKEQFVQPVKEQVTLVGAGQLNVNVLAGLDGVQILDDRREQGLGRFAKERVEVGSTDA